MARWADDIFTGSNGEPPNAERWANTNTEIQSNALYATVTGEEKGIISNFMLPGDFSIEIDFNLSAYPSTDGWQLGLYVSETAEFAGDDNFRIIIHYSNDRYYRARLLVGGVEQSQAGSSTTDTSGKLRIRRVTNTFYADYDNAGWVNLHSDTQAFGALYVAVRWLSLTGDPTFTTTIDNFTVNSGLVDIFETVTEGLGLADIKGTDQPEVIEGIGFDDSLAVDIVTEVIEGLGFSDSLISDTEVEISDSIGFSDAVSAFNWTEWLRENVGKYVTRFYCTLTGAADGVSDLEIPINSFQANKRTDEATYLSVIVPGFDYLSGITARSNGDVVIELAYVVDGVEDFREEILRVLLENIRQDEGPRNRSVTLSGHKTVSYGANLVELTDPAYKYVSEGKIRYRFSEVDPWVNPGDTIKCRNDEFRADFVNYLVSERIKQMEISEV